MKRGLLYYPMYVNDFDEDTLDLNLAETGLYLLCLNESWKRGGIPSTPAEIARIIRRKTSEVTKAWPAISRHWTLGDAGLLTNHRQEKERKIAEEKSTKARDSVLRRYHDLSTNVDTNVDTNDATCALLRASDSDSSEVKLQPKTKTSTREAEWFAEFWTMYPRKKAKPQAITSYRKAVKTEEQHAAKIQALREHLVELLSRPVEARPYPSTWINQQHELDEADPMPNGTVPRYESPQERAIREA